MQELYGDYSRHRGQIMERNYSRIFLLLLAVGMILLLSTQNNLLAQIDQRCFSETDLCISGRIRQFWEENGGLPIFGFPITPQHEETVENKVLQVQWFERNRLELHPENPRPYDVQLGRLGAARLLQQNHIWQEFPKSSPRADCRFFSETGHNVCGDILTAWRKNGLEFDKRKGKSEEESLALFGLPLSDAQIEMLSDGKLYTVQWFERARFEIHLENAAPYNVLLGLLGNEVFLYSTPTPTPLPTSTPTQTPEPTRKRHPRPIAPPAYPPPASPKPTLPAYP